MGHTITLAFELIWLGMLALACTVGLLARRPRGRRWLRRWIKLPTIIWWETERAIDPGGDVAGAIAELRSSVPGAKRALLPPWLLVRVTEDSAGATKVSLRAATLMQSKTAYEAAARITDALATLTEGETETRTGQPVPNGLEHSTRVHADAP